jgi:hypothetical protein
MTQVAYYPLTEGEDTEGEAEVEEWDFGGWHLPTMGVVLAFDDGDWALATWNSSFEHLGLEVTVAPSRVGLRDINPPGAPNEVLVGEHKRWAPFVGRPLTEVAICWSEWAQNLHTQGGPRQPLAVRLTVGGDGEDEECVWIAAGVPATWPFNGRFHLGTDDVLVIFDADLAERRSELRRR